MITKCWLPSKHQYCGDGFDTPSGEMRLPRILACLVCLLVTVSSQRPDDLRSPGLAQDLGQLFAQTVSR